jgi:hypothetical protein
MPNEMSEPEEQPPETRAAPPEKQRLIGSSAAVQGRQARGILFESQRRSVLRETPLAIYLRRQRAGK